MIKIQIIPSRGRLDGYYRAVGHAGEGRDAVCTAVTALEECLAANLANTFDLTVERVAAHGSYALRWGRNRKTPAESVRRANEAAGFVYTGLRALAKQFPEALRVTWNRPINDDRIEEETK